MRCIFAPLTILIGPQFVILLYNGSTFWNSNTIHSEGPNVDIVIYIHIFLPPVAIHNLSFYPDYINGFYKEDVKDYW